MLEKYPLLIIMFKKLWAKILDVISNKNDIFWEKQKFCKLLEGQNKKNWTSYCDVILIIIYLLLSPA